MKVISVGSELALLCIAVHYHEGIKNQCKQIWTFLEVFICGNIFYIFSTVTSLIFSLA